MFHVCDLTDDVPEPPENVRAVSVGKSEIIVTWDHSKTKPGFEFQVLAYTVHYKPYDGKWFFTNQ